LREGPALGDSVIALITGVLSFCAATTEKSDQL
jgi:hypothetical protein